MEKIRNLWGSNSNLNELRTSTTTVPEQEPIQSVEHDYFDDIEGVDDHNRADSTIPTPMNGPASPREMNNPSDCSSSFASPASTPPFASPASTPPSSPREASRTPIPFDNSSRPQVRAPSAPFTANAQERANPQPGQYARLPPTAIQRDLSYRKRGLDEAVQSYSPLSKDEREEVGRIPARQVPSPSTAKRSKTAKTPGKTFTIKFPGEAGVRRLRLPPMPFVRFIGLLQNRYGDLFFPQTHNLVYVDGGVQCLVTNQGEWECMFATYQKNPTISLSVLQQEVKPEGSFKLEIRDTRANLWHPQGTLYFTEFGALLDGEILTIKRSAEHESAWTLHSQGLQGEIFLKGSDRPGLYWDRLMTSPVLTGWRIISGKKYLLRGTKIVASGTPSTGSTQLPAVTQVPPTITQIENTSPVRISSGTVEERPLASQPVAVRSAEFASLIQRTDTPPASADEETALDDVILTPHQRTTAEECRKMGFPVEKIIEHVRRFDGEAVQVLDALLRNV